MCSSDLVLPSFLRTNSKLKQFLTNLSIWAIIVTVVEGVLDKNKKLIEEISSSEILEMVKNETITGGMIPKINMGLESINNGVTAVGIIDGRKQHSILFEIFSDRGSGTLIRK